jgi:exopolysaccharide production protein ExoZ
MFGTVENQPAFLQRVHNAGYVFQAPGFGASGVDLFFLISGFIMIYTSHAAFCRPGAPLSFLRRRAIRVVPMYWLYTTLVVLLLAFAPRLFSTVTFNWENAVASYLFLLSKIPGEGIGTVMQTGWTLCFEAYFYVLFAIFLNWPRRYLLIGLGFLFVAGSVWEAYLYLFRLG